MTYANGAVVSTSFLTNLEPEELLVRSLPDLYQAVDLANKRAHPAVNLPRYEYPDAIVTAAMVQRWCKYGVTYDLKRSDAYRIGTLDAQRPVGKSIYGNGYLLSSRAAAERAAAERAAAERWGLSDRERRIIAALDAGRAPTDAELRTTVTICPGQVALEAMKP